MVRVEALILTVLLVSTANADWFDDFVDSMHQKLVAGADYIKETAAPKVREKFNEAKETLQDPETHHTIREWIKEKYASASEFVQTEVVPEVKKMVGAYKEAANRDESSSEKKE